MVVWFTYIRAFTWDLHREQRGATKKKQNISMEDQAYLYIKKTAH